MYTLALAAVSMALQAYGMHEEAKNAEEMAKLKRGDIALQDKAIDLREKSRKINEELAEAKVRKDLRRAQAMRRVKAAISGTDYSSANIATSEGMITQTESGLQTQRELAGINSSFTDIERDRLGLQSASIKDQTDLDKIMGYAGIGISGALVASQDPWIKGLPETTPMTDIPKSNVNTNWQGAWDASTGL